MTPRDDWTATDLIVASLPAVLALMVIHRRRRAPADHPSAPFQHLAPPGARAVAHVAAGRTEWRGDELLFDPRGRPSP